MIKRIEEIELIRPLIIVCLVIYHSFAIYSGSWKMPEQIHNCNIYFWISKLSYSCMLETFTFISGYLYAHNLNDPDYSLKKVLTKKIQRLIMPCICFGTLYILLINDYNLNIPSFSFIYKIFNGCAHLWFLPMLFWCFISSFFIYKIKYKESSKLLILALFILFPSLPLPLQLNQTLYYLFYFYLGIYIFNKKQFIQILTKRRYIFVIGCCFIFLFITFTIIINESLTYDNISILRRSLQGVFIRCSRLIYATLGISFIYLTTLKIIVKHRIPTALKAFNKYCFGIYIIHHFLLPIIYYNSEIPQILGTYKLPWIACFLTLTLSILITKILLYFHFGRTLIG